MSVSHQGPLDSFMQRLFKNKLLCVLNTIVVLWYDLKISNEVAMYGYLTIHIEYITISTYSEN